MNRASEHVERDLLTRGSSGRIKSSPWASKARATSSGFRIVKGSTERPYHVCEKSLKKRILDPAFGLTPEVRLRDVLRDLELEFSQVFATISEPGYIADPNPQSDTQSLHLPNYRNEESQFSINHTLWFAISNMVRSLREQTITSWLFGLCVAGTSYALGGFDGLVKSAAGLAALSSILAIMADMKTGRLTLTSAVGHVLQFPGWMCAIAIGTFADKAGPEIFRAALGGFLVIPVCFGLALNNLFTFLRLSGLQTLTIRVLTAVRDWIDEIINRG
jgi:hypothetical protein